MPISLGKKQTPVSLVEPGKNAYMVEQDINGATHWLIKYIG
jgi:hypothetical protein